MTPYSDFKMSSVKRDHEDFKEGVKVGDNDAEVAELL